MKICIFINFVILIIAAAKLALSHWATFCWNKKLSIACHLLLETQRYMIAYYEAFKNKTRKKMTYVISCTSVLSSCFVINEILVFLRATIPIQYARHLHSCSYLLSALMCGLHFKNPVISISIWHSSSLSSYCSESLSSQVYTLTMCIPAQWKVRFCVLWVCMRVCGGWGAGFRCRWHHPRPMTSNMWRNAAHIT